MAVTYTKFDTTNFYVGLSDPVATPGTSTYTVTVDVYIKCYAIHYAASVYSFTVTLGSLSTTVAGKAFSDDDSTLKERKVGTATFTNVSPGTFNITATLKTSVCTYKNTSTGKQVSTNGATHTRSITLATLTSACTAPTSVSASGVVTPSGSFTLSWSGAGSGVNNTITSYQVYWYITSGGTAPTTSTYTGTKNVDVTDGTTSGSTTITLSSATRGYKVVCGVVTYGSAGSSYYSGIKTGGSVTINVQPNAPSLNQASQTISYGAGAVSVTATAGAMNTGSQTASVYYATSASGTKTKYTSAVSINPSATSIGGSNTSSTYYFWTYDGLEYSASYTSITITRNAPPKITAQTFTPTSYIAQNTDANNTYVSSVAVTATCSEACTMTIQILYGTSTTPGTVGYTTTKSITSTSSTSIGTYNINNLLKSVYTGARLYFKVRLSVSDGRDNGNTVDSSVYSIAATPSVSATYDQFSNSNKVDTSHMYSQIRILYPNDASMTSVSVTAKAGSTAITTSVTNRNSGKNGILDVTVPTNIGGGTTITFTISLSDGNITKTFTTSRVELPRPSIGSLTLSRSTINMYTDTANMVLTCTSPCNFSNNAPVAAADYWITSCVINVASNTSGGSYRAITGTITGTTNSTFTATIAKTTFANFGDFGKSSYNGTATGYVQITFTDKYGRVFSTGYKSYTLNYNTDPTTPTMTLQYSTDNSNWSNLSTNKLQEGLYIQAIVSCTAYTNSTLTAKLYYKIGSGSNNLVATSTASVSNGTSGQSKPFTLKYSGTLPQISSIDNWTWTVEISNNITSTIKSTTATTGAIKHISPTVVLNSLTSSRSGTTTTFKYDLTLRDSGVSGATSSTTTYQFFLSNGTTSTSATFTATSGSINDSDTTAWAQKTVKVKATTTATGLITTTKSSFSGTITLYTEQPTVAYRSNQLGINTDSPSDTAVLDVTSYKTKTVILLGSKGTGDQRFEIGLTTNNLYIDII